MVLYRAVSMFNSNSVQCFSILRSVLHIRILARRWRSTECSNGDTVLIALEESRRFITQCMEAVGTPTCQAEALADLLAEADYRGHYNQGLKRLERYVCDVKSGICDPCATPKILQENKATAWVDGQNGLGVVVGQFCMDLAIKKAKDIGVGWVTAKGSNHYGMASMYSLQALEQELIGMSFTNTSPLMSPTRSKEAALGTNPLSLAAPADDDDSVVLDMTTSTVDLEKIEEYKHKKKPLPEGWAQDTEGRITTDPEIAYEARRLMPLGGAEINSGYNGYGLGLMVETFCGVLAGAHYGPNIRKWEDTSEAADLGQTFVAVTPGCFAPGFECRLSKLLKELRDMEPADPCKPVLVAGDPEKLHMVTVDKDGGVRYEKYHLETCQRLSKALKVAPLKPL